MPVTLPPAAISQELPADTDRLPGALSDNERKQWLVAIKSAPRAQEPCAEATNDEIVVCAPVYDDPARDRIGPPLPDPPTAMEELRQKLRVKIGPGELSAGGNPRMVGFTYKLKF